MAHFTNVQLAEAINDLIQADVDVKTNMQAWLAGVVGGGPNTDGEYPLIDYQANSVLTKCPAQLEDDVANEVTGALGYKNEADAAQTASETAQTAAEAAETAAELAEANAVVAKDTAVTAKNDAESARTVAIAQATAAAASAVAAAASASAASSSETAAGTAQTAAELAETNAETAEIAAELAEQYAEAWANTIEDTLVANPPGDGTTEYSALHWAAKAATFNPVLYATLAGATFTGPLITEDSATGAAGFNIPTGVAPTSPNQGDIWVVADDILARINGVSTSLLGGGGGGGGTAWEQVSGADTIAAGEGFLVTNSGGAFDIDLEATIAADDEYIIHNSRDSTGAESIEPNTGHTIKGTGGDVVGDTDTLVLAAGETVHLVAVSSSILEVV